MRPAFNNSAATATSTLKGLCCAQQANLFTLNYETGTKKVLFFPSISAKTLLPTSLLRLVANSLPNLVSGGWGHIEFFKRSNSFFSALCFL